MIEILYGIELLVQRITGRAMETDVNKMVPEFQNFDSPFIAIMREFTELNDRILQSERKYISSEDLSYKQLLVLHRQCEAYIETAFGNSHRFGISIKVNQSLLRIRQQLERIKDMLSFLVIDTESQKAEKSIELAKTLIGYNSRKSNIRKLIGQSTQLLAYAVHSDSDIAVVGGTNVIGKGDLAGLRLIRSLGGGDGFYHSLTLGFDWKSFKEDVILGSDRAAAPIEYFPLMASWRGDWSGETRRSDLTFSGVLGVRGLGDDKWAFDAKRYNARPSFFTVKVDASHTEELVHDLQLMARLSAQWTDRPLISNEQFGIGGSNTVRAYRESEAMGDYGLATQLEMRSPPLLADWPGVDELRLYGFWDAGFVGIHDPLPGQKGENLLMSAGVGGRLRLFQYLNGAVDVGTPLISMPGRDAGLVSVRFRIWGEF